MRRILPIFLFLGLVACNPANMAADVAASGKAIDAFHADANAGKFDDIYYASGEEMQRSADVKDFEDFMGAVRRKLGKSGKTKQQGWQVNTTNGLTLTALNMETTYEKGRAVETFTFKSSPKGPILVGYNIQSPALVIN